MKVVDLNHTVDASNVLEQEGKCSQHMNRVFLILYWSYLVIHKVGNVVNFVLLRSEG